MVGIIVILVGVFYVAIGRGGELAYEQADHAPLDLGPVSPTDVALLRPPTALWGYNMQVTDEALDRIARALRDRDVLIASLQRQVGDAGRDQPMVTAIEAESLMGATGLTQPARWDEVILARDEAATALDEDLDKNAADTAADTAVIEAVAPATDEIPSTDAAETSALRTVDTAEVAEQPRRFVPKHERPRKTPPAITEADKPDDNAEEQGW